MLTDRLRERLAARFGSRGRGYVSVGRASTRLQPAGVQRRLQGSFTIADGREVVSGGALGMSGTKTRLEPGASFEVAFGQQKGASSTPGFLQLAWLYTPDMGSADVLVDGTLVASLDAEHRRRENDVQFLRLPVGRENVRLQVVARRDQKIEPNRVPGTATMSAVGPVHLLSVSEELEQRGIVVDAIGLPGTTGMTPQRWRQDLYAEEVKARDYDLVITAWGTNESGIASLDAATYKHHFKATLATLMAASPRADCLLIGGSDRWDKRGGRLVPAPAHDLVERVQREIAAEQGCAFFSMSQAMGGRGGMKQWVRTGLGHEDHVHFTRKGYTKMADLLADDLLAAWRWRSEQEGGGEDEVATASKDGAKEAVDGADADDGADAVPIGVPIGVPIERQNEGNGVFKNVDDATTTTVVKEGARALP